MSNWFECSPARSVIVHTMVVAGAVWAAFAFIVDENKVSVFRAQAENEKAAAGQYRAKTEILEVELARLRDENKKYQEWLSATPNTIPYFEARLKSLSDENTKLRTELASVNRGAAAASSPETGIARNLYSARRVLSLGEAFVDPRTNATLGIGVISSNFTATATVTLPGQAVQSLQALRSGDNWKFVFSGKRYQLTALKVDWFSNKAEVSVNELP